LKLAAQSFEVDKPFHNKRELLEHYIETQLDPRLREKDRENPRRKWAFTTYRKEPSLLQTKDSLAWLACRMRENYQIELLIDGIKPIPSISSWMPTKSGKFQYRLLVGLFYGIYFASMIGLAGDFSYTISKSFFNIFYSSRTQIIFLSTTAGFSLGIFLGTLSASFGSIFPVKSISTKSFLLSLNRLTRKHFTLLLIGGFAGIFLRLNTVFIIAILFLFLYVRYIFSGEWNYFSDSPSEPNQGIKESFQNFVVLSLTTLAIVIWIVAWKTTLTVQQLQQVMWLGSNLFLAKVILSMTLAGMLVIALPLGGHAVIQHLCLRIVFTRHYGIPWNLAQFLTYCHERLLLQQIGGSYRFIHRELLDHFANHSTR
jgi:hypothetical protein